MKRQMTVGLYRPNLRKFKYNQRQSLDKIETRWLFFTANKLLFYEIGAMAIIRILLKYVFLTIILYVKKVMNPKVAQNFINPT